MKRAVLTWIVFDALLSGAGLFVVKPGTGAFILCGLMLTVGILCGLALLAVAR